MLDNQTETMLNVASKLTAEELDAIGVLTPATEEDAPAELPEDPESDGEPLAQELPAEEDSEPFDGSTAVVAEKLRQSPPGTLGTSRKTRGEYERRRTRESKVSTACVGHEREKHEWWPLNTKLEGWIGGEVFTAVVVENPQVKSGRSLLITSGPASGKVCFSPTRAAIEATESFRQAHNLGRGGGVTNGWGFWRPSN